MAQRDRRERGVQARRREVAGMQVAGEGIFDFVHELQRPLEGAHRCLEIALRVEQVAQRLLGLGAGARVVHQGQRLLDVGLRVLAADQRLRASQLQQRLGASLLRQRLCQHAREIVDGGGRIAAQQRLSGSGAQRGDRPLLPAPRCGEQLTRHLLHGCVLCVQQLRRTQMRKFALSLRYLVVDRLAQERVRKGDGVRACEDVRSRERVRCRGGRCVRQPREVGDVRERRVLGDDGRGGREPSRVKADARDPHERLAAEHLGTQPRDLWRVRVRWRYPVVAQGAHDRPCEERVARARFEAGAREVLADLLFDAMSKQLRHRCGAERREREHLSERVRRELLQQLATIALPWPVRKQQRDWQLVYPLGEVDEEAQRDGVAPMRVIDSEQQRLPGGEVGHEPEQPVQ